METKQTFPDSWAALRFPEMRCELISILRDLSDLDYQQRVWASNLADPTRTFDTLGNALKELIDTRGYNRDEYIDAAIGGELLNTAEAAAVKRLCESVIAVSKDLRGAPAERYFSDIRWPCVVTNAKSAMELMLKA